MWNSRTVPYPDIAMDGAQRPEEVAPAVGVVGGAGEDLLERAEDRCAVDRARGNVAWPAAGANQTPRPGISAAAANGVESITASAPQAIAAATSPPVAIGPSATTCT